LFDYRARQTQVFGKLKKAKKIPFLITSLTDIHYLTGFSGTDAILLFGKNGIAFGTDGRYDVQTRHEVVADNTFIYGRKREFIRKFLKKGENVYFDRERFSFSMYTLFQKWGYLPHPSVSPLMRMRMVKEQREIDMIEQAAIISSTAFLASLESLKSNTTENELAATIEFEMKKRGAEGSSFPPIVAFGHKSAMPHAAPDDSRLNGAEIMLFDYGCRYRGYCSDETVSLLRRGKKVDRELEKVMTVVRRAKDEAFKVLMPGARCRDVDLTVRKFIDQRGYGRFFVHSTGHGVGMEIHEPPIISRFSRDVFKPGMVVTIEPGIYIPGKGGIRLEDLVKITENGFEKISYLPKDGRDSFNG
jgi:Xaa-Pro aminopeptidase